MAEKEIKKEIGREIQERITELLDSSRKKADAIIKQAQEEAASLKEKHSKEIDKTNFLRKSAIISTFQLSVKKEILIEQEKLFNSLVDAVDKELDKTRNNQKAYRLIIKSLITSSLEYFNDTAKLKIKISTTDIPLCRDICREAGYTFSIEPLDVSAGGLVMCDKNEKKICDNLFTSRLKKLEPELRRKLYRLLYS